MVADRTRELEEGKGRLQAILDNVPSAFVMLDPDGRIRTASAAFTSITGLVLGDVQDAEIGFVLRAAGLCTPKPAPGCRRPCGGEPCRRAHRAERVRALPGARDDTDHGKGR